MTMYAVTIRVGGSPTLPTSIMEELPYWRTAQLRKLFDPEMGLGVRIPLLPPVCNQIFTSCINSFMEECPSGLW